MQARTTWLVAVVALAVTCANRVPRVAGTLEALAGKAGGIAPHANDAPTSACSLVMTTRAPPGVAGYQRQLQAKLPPPGRRNGWCGDLTDNVKFYNARCDTLPAVSPSPGCAAFDPADSAAWMPAEPRTVWFWGDSLTLQLWDHLLCFLSRHVSEDAPPVLNNGTGYNATGEHYGSGGRRALLASAASRRAARLRNQPSVRIAWGKRGVGGQLLQKPLKWNPKLSSRMCVPDSPCVRFGKLKLCFGEKWKDSAWVSPESVSCFLNSAPDDVHVLNFGLWHNDAAGVPRAVQSMARFFQTAARARAQPLPHLVWLETAPQHFNSKGGLYYRRRGKVKPGCMERAQPAQLSNFRNKMTLRILDDAHLLSVAPMHIFRSWQMLAAHPELHNRVNRGMLDCTHWCAYDGSVLSALAHILLSDISRTFWRAR
eukprot:jgi/Tetstr1/422228/TSEL_013080.t1